MKAIRFREHAYALSEIYPLHRPVLRAVTGVTLRISIISGEYTRQEMPTLLLTLATPAGRARRLRISGKGEMNVASLCPEDVAAFASEDVLPAEAVVTRLHLSRVSAVPS
jgi:hypothetical protein